MALSSTFDAAAARIAKTFGASYGAAARVLQFAIDRRKNEAADLNFTTEKWPELTKDWPFKRIRQDWPLQT